VIESEMDETQLIFFGVEWGSHTPRVGVFDFGRVQPVCQHQPKSEISCSGYMNLEILDYIPENSVGANSQINIPFSRCVNKVTRCVVKPSVDWYDTLKWPLILSAYTILGFLLIKYQKK
jgi:hypothetical protein